MLISPAAQPLAVSNSATIPPNCPSRRDDSRSIARTRQPSRHPPAPTEAVVVRAAPRTRKQDQVDPSSCFQMQHFCPLDSSVPCLKSRLGNLTHNTEVLCDAGDKGHSRKDDRLKTEQEAKGKNEEQRAKARSVCRASACACQRGVKSTGCKTPETVWNRYRLPP